MQTTQNGSQSQRPVPIDRVSIRIASIFPSFALHDRLPAVVALLPFYPEI